MIKFILLLGTTLSFAGFLLTAYNGLLTGETSFYLFLQFIFFICIGYFANAMHKYNGGK